MPREKFTDFEHVYTYAADGKPLPKTPDATVNNYAAWLKQNGRAFEVRRYSNGQYLVKSTSAEQPHA